VDLSLSALDDPDDGLISSYKWKSNLLCGIYKEELSSSVYFPQKAEVDIVRKHQDLLKKKKYSFMVVKHSLMRLKTTKQEVYVFKDKDSPPLEQNNYINYSSCVLDKIKTPRSNPVCEKIKKLYSPELILAPEPTKIGVSGIQTTKNFQTSQSKQFVRNYLKTKAVSTEELRTASDDNKPDEASDINGSAFDSCRELQITATALRDCVPSPYDCEGLAFRKGDLIKVTSMNANGIWRGRCQNREGNFKFIDVKLHNPLKRHQKKMQSQLQNVKSKSVSDLLTAVHLENLTSVFVLNGYDTADDIKHLSVDDLDYLGIDDTTRDIILDSVDKVLPEKDPRTGSDSSIRKDSGFNSSDSDVSSATESYFLPSKTFLYP